MDKQQSLSLCLIIDHTQLDRLGDILAALHEHGTPIKACHINESDRLYCCSIQLSDTWQQLAKCELQIKKLCQSLNVTAIFQRGNPPKNHPEPVHCYEVEAASSTEEDITAPLLDFMNGHGLTVFNCHNEITHNRQGFPMRLIHMHIGVPMDHSLSDLHESLYDFFELHHVDGKLSLLSD